MDSYGLHVTFSASSVRRSLLTQTLLTLLTHRPDCCAETPMWPPLVPPLSFRAALCWPSVVPHCEPRERPPQRRNAPQRKSTEEIHNCLSRLPWTKHSALSELSPWIQYRWGQRIHASPQRLLSGAVFSKHRVYYETMLSLLACLLQNKVFHPRGKVNSSCSQCSSFGEEFFTKLFLKDRWKFHQCLIFTYRKNSSESSHMRSTKWNGLQFYLKKGRWINQKLY